MIYLHKPHTSPLNVADIQCSTDTPFYQGADIMAKSLILSAGGDKTESWQVGVEQYQSRREIMPLFQDAVSFRGFMTQGPIMFNYVNFTAPEDIAAGQAGLSGVEGAGGPGFGIRSGCNSVAPPHTHSHAHPE
jgi:hypothetical protein